MLGCQNKALLLLLALNFLLYKCYGDREYNKDDSDDKTSARIMMAAYASPSQHSYMVSSHDYEDKSFIAATPIDPILAAYLESADAKRASTSWGDLDYYVHMLMDGLLEEWRPFHPHTDAEALQMVRDFIASRNVNSDLAYLKPEYANHGKWRERLKHLLIHYVKQPYVKQHSGLLRAMKWYLNKLKRTIWVRRRLLQRRKSIARMNLLFSYLQAHDHAADQREYRFDIYKEIDRTTELKRRLEELSTLSEVKRNPELTAAFNYYIGKLSEALEETKKRQTPSLSNITIQNMPFAAPKPENFPRKMTTYVDTVQDFIERKKSIGNTSEILDGKSLDTVGGIRTFLEHYLSVAEVKENATLADAINTFLGNIKKLPSHHLLDRHLKRETVQKMVTKYEVVYEYLSKLEWKRSGSPEEVLQRALENPDVQHNITLLDAINYYLEHTPKQQEEDVEEEEEEEEEKPVEEETAPK